MIFKNYKWRTRLFLKVLLMFAMLMLELAFLVVHQQYKYLFLILPLYYSWQL